MNFSINIGYDAIVEQTKKLSVFEGREAAGPSGESAYESILITEQDEALVRDYMTQALGTILQKIGRMVAEVGYIRTIGNPDPTGEVWVLRESGYDSAKFGAVLAQHIQEAACAYIMQLWLSSRAPERKDFYGSLFTNMLHLVNQNVHSRTVSRPTYQKDEDDND